MSEYTVEPSETEATAALTLKSVMDWVGLKADNQATLHELLGTEEGTHPRAVANIAEADFTVVLVPWSPQGRTPTAQPRAAHW